MPPKKATVFKETYERYLGMIEPAGFESNAEILGGRCENDSMFIRFFNTEYEVSPRGVFDPRGEPAGFAVSVVLLKYLLMCPESVPSGPDEWVAYRDFKDAGPLISYFTSNTNKTLETAFAGNPDKLCQALEDLGGNTTDFSAGYDVSREIAALPRMPVIVNFNDRDLEFPAVCSVLFRRSTEHWLDMECVAIAATFLAGKLLRTISNPDE